MVDEVVVTATRLPGNVGVPGTSGVDYIIPLGILRRDPRSEADVLNWVRAWHPEPFVPPPPPRGGDETPPQDAPIAPQGPIDEVVVVATPPSNPALPIIPITGAGIDAYGSMVVLGRPAPAPRPRPRPRPRRAPKKPPPKRRPDTRPKRGPRIVPQIVKFARTLLRLGRVASGVGGVLIPTDLNDGEGEFLDDYFGPLIIPPGDDERRRTPAPDSGGLPNDLPIDSITVVRPRIPDARVAAPAPFVPFVPVPLFNFGEPGPRMFGTPNVPQPLISPRPTPTRRPVNDPQLFPTPGPSPLDLPAPSPRPAPQTNPRTTSPPRTTAPPFPFYTAPLIPGPGSLQLPIAQPVPQPEPNKDCCPCSKPKKKKKKKDPRTECREGTYRQLSKGIVYKPKRKIPCQ